MRRFFVIVLIPVLALTMVLAGCNIFGDRTELSPRAIADLEELRAMIPAIEAALMVATPVEAVAGTTNFRTMTYTPAADAPPTPDECYNDDAAAPDINRTVRYPYAAGTFIDNFYGTAGNKAYFTLRPHATSPDLYVMDLYIYPTLSTTLNYVHEQYLVAGDSAGWALVDAGGAASPLNYLVNETVYFVRTVQVNDVQWTRYSDSFDESYDIPAVGDRVPDNFSALAYDYPSDPNTMEPAKAAGVTGRYSAKIVSTIADRGITVVEYYTDSDLNGSKEAFAVSYVNRNDTTKYLSIAEKTVRRYYENDEDGKTIRSRTEAAVDYGTLFSSSSVVTDWTAITTSATGAIVLESVIEGTEAGTGTVMYTISTTLTESGQGTNVFTGTLISDAGAAGTVTYDLALSATTGLQVSGTGGLSTDGTFAGMNRRQFEDFVVELRNGGVFTGRISKKEIKGLYKRLSKEVDVYVSLTAVLGVSGAQSSMR